MAYIEWTENGNHGLHSIARFMAEQNQSIERALQVINRIEEKCKLVAEFPASRMARPDLGDGLRSTLVDNFVIIYRPLTKVCVFSWLPTDIKIFRLYSHSFGPDASGRHFGRKQAITRPG